MRCVDCGARYETPAARCPECGARQENEQVEATPVIQTIPVISAAAPEVPKIEKKPRLKKPAPSLIAFPGITPMPQWRRELGERVRERRMREGDAEGAAVFTEVGAATATLELLPKADAADVNPLVIAALRRIERARNQPANMTNATALAVQPNVEIETQPEEEVAPEPPKPERVHNLAVVPTPEPIVTENPQDIRKPIRVIGDQNDPALNYLDSIPTTITVDARGYRAAPLPRRMLSGLTDLAVMIVLSLPFLMLPGLTSIDWANPRVIAFSASTFIVVSFLYLTVSTAFTGRSLGMKLFSLRVVDARTGLIPTGSQSAGRAIVYILSLAPAGLVLLTAFIDREKYTLHDRFTHTAVVCA